MAYNANADFELLTQEEIEEALLKFINIKTNSTYTLDQLRATNWDTLNYLIVQAVMYIDNNFAFLRNDINTILPTLNQNFLPRGSASYLQNEFYNKTGHIIAFKRPELNKEAGHFIAAIDIKKIYTEKKDDDGKVISSQTKLPDDWKTTTTAYYDLVADAFFDDIFNGEMRAGGTSPVQGMSSITFDCMNEYHVKLEYQISVFLDTEGCPTPRESLKSEIEANIKAKYRAGDNRFAPFAYITDFEGRTFADTCTLTITSAITGNTGKPITSMVDKIYTFDKENTLFSIAAYNANIIVDDVTVEYVTVKATV